MLKLISFLIALTLPAMASATTISGQVVYVSDGDTLTVKADKIYTVRLAQIDAPEISHRGIPAQPYGMESKKALSGLTLGSMVTVEYKDTDMYGRYLGVVIKDGVNINMLMVQEGHAWVYAQYNKDPSFLLLEKAAQSDKIGLWATPKPIAPWIYRRTAQ